MYKNFYLFTILIYFNYFFNGAYCINIEDTELLMTFLVHRHGDRTPIKDQLYLSNDMESLDNECKIYGYGQLTNIGKRRSYKIGEFIRRRYDKLLSRRYNSSEIYIRSTSFPRCIMTTLVAMAAVYPAKDDKWSNTINWTPVPFVTVPSKYDYNTAMISCPKYSDSYEDVKKSNPPVMTKYRHIVEKLSTELGLDLSEKPLKLSLAYDLYLCQKGLGLPLTPALEELLPELEKGAVAAFSFMFGDDANLSLQTGVFLNEFYKAATTVMSGNSTQRVWILSAHDFNVFSMMRISKVLYRPGHIKFGAVFALELRKDPKTGIVYVLPVYVSSPGHPEKYLKVEGCDDVLCDYDLFVQITSENALDYDSWKKQCEFSNDNGFPFFDDHFNFNFDFQKLYKDIL